MLLPVIAVPLYQDTPMLLLVHKSYNSCSKELQGAGNSTLLSI